MAHPLWDGPLGLLAASVLTALMMDVSFYRYLRGVSVPIIIATMVYRAINTPDETTLLEWVTSHLIIKDARVSFFVKDALGLILVSWLVGVVRQCRRWTWAEVKAWVGDGFFNLVKHLPLVQKQLKEEADKLEKTLEHSLRPQGGWPDPIRTLPAKGRAAQDIIAQLKSLSAQEVSKWRDGYVSGAVYSGEPAVLDLMGQASALYSVTNPLHPDLWPSLMKFEAEICSMVVNMVNGGDSGVVGSLTSGGTESILLAAKTHRDYYRAEKGITDPEVVACTSAHAAIDKACSLMGIRLVKIPMNPKTFQLDLAAMERAISSSTVMLYCSAPTFGQGVIDPIAAVARLGLKYGVGVHVDCCLGGFILPFAKKLGGDGVVVPDFDFGLPGVTSMSVDTHKYGYASKGTSVVVYRSKELRHHQYFCFPSWTGGLYVTPTVAGSRPGALSAACWAAMVHMGEEGYLKRAKEILGTARAIAKGVQAIPGIHLQGAAEAMIVCIGGSEDVNVYSLGDHMTKKGWALNSLQDPAGLHLCCTYRHVGRAKQFLDDLKQAVEEVRAASNTSGGGKKTKKKSEGNAAIYGMASSLPAGPIKMMLCTYTDVVLKA